MLHSLIVFIATSSPKLSPQIVVFVGFRTETDTMSKDTAARLDKVFSRFDKGISKRIKCHWIEEETYSMRRSDLPKLKAFLHQLGPISPCNYLDYRVIERRTAKERKEDSYRLSH